MSELTQAQLWQLYTYWSHRERDRIIKLLEPLAQHSEECASGCRPNDCSAYKYQHYLKLLKGVQK